MNLPINLRIKTFSASSLEEAVALAKRDLGEDAIFLQTNKVTTRWGLLGLLRRDRFEVTATNHLETESAPPRPAASGGPASPALRLSSSSQRKRRDAAAGMPGATDTISPGGPGKTSLSTRRRAAATESAPKATRATPGGDQAATARQAETPPALTAPEPATPSSRDQELRLIQQQIGSIRLMVRELLAESKSARNQPGGFPDELLQMFLLLAENGVSSRLADEIIRKNTDFLFHPGAGKRENIDKLRRLLIKMMPECRPIENQTSAMRFVAFVGPTGVGKTTTIAKIAANFKFKQQARVGLVTVDTFRIAAVEQLRIFAQIMGVPLKVVNTPEEMKSAIAGFEDRDLVLLDTAGRSQRDTERMSELEPFFAVRPPDETHLLIASNVGRDVAFEVYEQFSCLPVNRVILTKVDEATNLGLILELANKFSFATSYYTFGQNVPDDIAELTPSLLVRLILGEEDFGQRSG